MFATKGTYILVMNCGKERNSLNLGALNVKFEFSVIYTKLTMLTTFALKIFPSEHWNLEPMIIRSSHTGGRSNSFLVLGKAFNASVGNIFNFV